MSAEAAVAVPQDPDDPIVTLGRRCWAALETLHVVAYFAPEPAAAYKELGLRSRAGYFASRSAAMGPVPAEVTVATFYVFAPQLVAEHLPAAWDVAAPADVLAARHRGVTATLRRVLGDVDVSEAVGLARTACAGLRPQGRALYAGHAALDWPEDPLLALWHAAALLLAGLDPVEALVTGGLTSGRMPFLKATRGWTDEQWAAAEERLRGRGLLGTDGALTAEGVQLRTRVEEQTDRSAGQGWQALGPDGSARLLELVQPLRASLFDSEVFPPALFGRP